MTLKSNFASKKNHLIKRFWQNQKGVFPPFMFGTLMGVGLFSTISVEMAKKQLIELEETRAERYQSEREDVAKGLEFAILTETDATYSDDLSLDRARQYTSKTSGKTQGKSNFQLVERRTEDAFGTGQKRILINSNDDILHRAKLSQIGDAKEMNAQRESGKNGVTLFNSSAVRFRQVENTKKTMDIMAEAIYRFYSGNLTFPTGEQYENLAEKLALKDVWGNPFTYVRISDTQGTLEFTTPWNYSQKVDMNLK